MSDFVIFILNRFIFRISEFIRQWYIEGFNVQSHHFFSFLEKLDRFFALKVTWKYLFAPLYQEPGVIGYTLGFIFRSIRLITGGLVYSILSLIAMAVYITWAAVPVFIVLKMANCLVIGRIFGDGVNF